MNNSDLLEMGVDESYELIVSRGISQINAESVWGALHALESFSQSMYFCNNKSTFKYMICSHAHFCDFVFLFKFIVLVSLSFLILHRFFWSRVLVLVLVLLFVL